MSIDLNHLFRSSVDSLSTVYGDSEARWLTRVIFQRLKEWDRTYIILHGSDIASDFLCTQVNDIVKRLLNHEPVQHIFGVANFYGMDFKVTADTLIPRPETAELVDFIVKDSDNRPDLRILDIGTGTGCIAIALARNIPFAKVTGIDISPAAIAVAIENAQKLHTNVEFRQADALNLPTPESDSLDIIVSNPPYILPSEKTEMSRNVLDFEPHSALFVPQDNPLLFYIAIAVYAQKSLVKNGDLWFEINPLCAKTLKSKIEQLGFDPVELIFDSQKRLRFLHAKQP